MQPTPKLTPAPLRSQRRRPFVGLPGPYAGSYPGQLRPYPEPRRGARTAPRPPRIPLVAALAGLFGLAGAPPLVLVVISVVGQRSQGSDAGIDWWPCLFLAVPVLEVVGAYCLLSARSWRLLVLSCVPGAALFGYVVWARFAGPVDLRPGWMSFALACPPLAMLLGVLPPVRHWVAARRRFVALRAVA